MSSSEKNLKLNNSKIDLLKKNKFFMHEFTNKMGLELVKYLTNMSYYTLFNRDPLDLEKGNTLAKIFNYLKVIDNFVQKPLNEYTQQDMEKFILTFQKGELAAQQTRVKKSGKRVSVKVYETDRKRNVNALDRYVYDFKRFWKVYYEYAVANADKENPVDVRDFQWGLNLAAPIIKKKYVDYPWKSLQELIHFANQLHLEEYKVRFLVGLNLMGRECELSSVTKEDIDYRDNGCVFVKLPDVKKNSSAKVPVELFTYAKEPLTEYLRNLDVKPNKPIFPSKSTAYAKNLRVVSEKLWGKKDRITPKTIRKLGVCVAEQLGISRENVERIGGWSVNSPILSHYFKRKGVAVEIETDNAVEKARNKNLYVELDRIKAESFEKDREIDLMRKEFEMRMKMLEEQVLKRAQKELAGQ